MAIKRLLKALAEDRLWWHELTDSEKKALKDHAPIEVVSIVEDMDPEERSLVYRAIGPKDPKKYNLEQRPWIEDCEYYAGLHLNHQPSQVEVTEELFSNQNHVRYRLCYFAIHPDEIQINNNATPESLDAAALFFLNVKRAREQFRVNSQESANIPALDSRTAYPKFCPVLDRIKAICA